MKKVFITREYFDKRIDNLKRLIFGVFLWLLFSISLINIKINFLNSLIMLSLFVTGAFFVIKSLFFENKESKR